MAVLRKRIEIYEKLEDDYTWSTTPKVVDRAMQIQVKYSYGKRVDTGSFRVSQTKSDGISVDNGNSYVVKFDDRIKIYQWYGDDWSSLTDTQKEQALLLDATVLKLDGEFNGQHHYLTLTLGSLIDSFLRTPIPIDESGLKTNELLQQVFEIYNGLNTNRQISWDTNNPTTKSNGDPFPTIDNYFKNWTPMVEIIEELSSSTYTDDGRYIYYLEWDYSTGQIKFRWLHKDDTSTPSAIFTEDRTVLQIKASKDLNEMINWIAMHAGKDAFENSITVFDSDEDSIAKNGVKAKYITAFAYLADDLLYQEARSQSSAYEWSGNHLKYRHPQSLAYPYTFTYSGVTVNDDSEFNTEFRRIVKLEGSYITQSLLRTLSLPRYKMNMTARYISSDIYQIGSIAKVYLNRMFGSHPEYFRISAITYKGPHIILELSQDEDTVKASLNG